MTISGDRYSNWSSWLRERWGTRVYKIPLDTGAGCPNRDGIERGGCIFCDSLGGGGGAFLRGESLEEQIMRGFRRLEKKPGDPMAIIYLQSYSSSNVSTDRFAALIEKTLKISHSLGKVAGLAVGARPDQVPDEILDILEEAGIRNSIDVWLELGIQTVDPSGLEWLRRGHDLAASEDAAARTSGRRLFLCGHLISGIPHERPNQLAGSAIWMANRGFDAVKFHPLHVLRGTALEKEFVCGNYSPQTAEEYVSEVITALRVLPKKMLIQRLSADASPEKLRAPLWINDKSRVIAMIRHRLEAYGAFQGDNFTASSES